MMSHPAARALLAGAAILATACGTVGDSGAAHAQEPPTLVAVSEYTNAGYNDLAIGADGVVHAVWQDALPGASFQIFYSASRDGVRWSEPIALSSPDENATRVRVAIDGGGRVYALWKTWNGGNSSGPEFNSTNTLGSIFGSLRYRVLEGDQWSPVVPVGRENNVFSFFSSVDPAGRVHVVWSENSDPERESATPWIDWAKTIRKASLDGFGSESGVIASDLKAGIYALDGYVDEQGAAHFVGIGNQQLLYWTGNQWVAVLEGLTGNDEKEAARLLRDARGIEHLILLQASDGVVVDYPVGEGAQPRVVYQLPDPGSSTLQGLQAWQGTGGQMIVTIEVEESARKAADLYVAVSNGGDWSAASNVTGNAMGDQSAGYIGAGGNHIVGGGAWTARYASAAVEPSGALGLLITNLRSTTSTRSDMYVFGGGWSSPQVYFTRLGGDGIRPSDAPPPPVTIVTDGTVPPAPSGGDDVTPDPVPAPEPAPEMEPAPAPVAAGGLPTGQYQCHYVSQYAGPIPTGMAISILDGGRYQSFDGSTGTYSFDPESETVEWTSGPFAGGTPMADFYRRDDGKPTIEVVTGDPSSDPSRQNYCVLY